MVGAATPVLTPRRAAALLVALALLVAWEAGAGAFPDVGRWPDVLFVALILLPVTFTVPWFGLPTASSRAVLPFALAAVGAAVVLDLAGASSFFNVAKLLALIAIGFFFLQVFEALAWIALVAAIIPWVDALSVWRGPTSYVVSEQPSLFDRISISFRLPGEDGSANIGPPDIIFFALFLGAAARFGLRVRWTWISMAGLLSLTLVLTSAFETNGLPALPAIAVGFLLPNADLLWDAWRARGLELSGD